MSGARLTAALECANDAEVRFTLWPSSDSHGDSRVSAGAAASYASGDQAVRHRAGGTGRGGSDPPVRGPGSGAGPCVFSHAGPAPWGVAPGLIIPRGKAIERRWRWCRYGDQPSAHRQGGRGARPPPAHSAGARASGGSKGGRSAPSPTPNVSHWVGWLSRRSGQTRPPTVGTLGRQNRHTRTLRSPPYAVSNNGQ